MCKQATIEEDKIYADTKKQIREDIRNMRHRVSVLVHINSFRIFSL